MSSIYVLPRQFNTEMEYEATHLRDDSYAVRPKGALGTCGWINGIAWTVVYVTAYSQRFGYPEGRGSGVHHLPER